jgi:hypothetical protein
VRFSRERAKIGFEQRKCRWLRRGGSELLPGYIIWWRTRFRTSTRWRFLNLLEERLEATGQEMVGCVPDIARYFRITDHLGMVPPGLDPVVGGKGAGVDHRYRAR